MAIYDNDEEIERARVYRLFARLFIEEPPDELLLEIREMFGITADDLPLEIRLDFTNLFFSSGGHLRPYESFFNYPLGDKPRLWGKAAENVQSFYNSAGLMLDEQINLIPDHISAELLFMSYLVEQGLFEEQKKFVGEHLLKWIPEYCDEVQRHAATTFYKEVANFLKEFILSEHKLINE